jgi:hypothetical protein
MTISSSFPWVHFTSYALIHISYWAHYIGAPPAVLFPVLYLRSPWRSSAVGKAVMTLAVALAVILTQGTIRDAGWATPPLWINAVLYPCLAFALWRQLLVLLRLQRRRSDRKRNGDPAEELR